MNDPLNFGYTALASFYRSIFRIESDFDGQRRSGTGFVIGRFLESKCLVLATAKHVIDYPRDAAVKWKFSQFNLFNEPEREVQCLSNTGLIPPPAPWMTHNTLDIGTITLPQANADGSLFSADDEAALPMISPHLMIGAGTRVGWAGFPGVVEEIVGSPQLCYFEGVVSCIGNRSSSPMYFIDGHNSFGVSGGPVWHYSEEQKRFEVIGIVCSYYSGTEGHLPGFCHFEPLNPLAILLRAGTPVDSCIITY